MNSDGFTIEQAYPIEDENTVLVDYDLSVLRAGSRVTLRVNTATGSRAKLKLQGSASDTDDFVEIASTDLANAVIDVDVEPRNEVENPTVIATYPVKGKLISNKPDAKLDGYQVVLFCRDQSRGRRTGVRTGRCRAHRDEWLLRHDAATVRECRGH